MSARFKLKQAVDFAIIGSGAAGGILARELSAAGFDVVLFEQGKHRRSEDFRHDELNELFNWDMCGGTRATNPQLFRESATQEAELRDAPLAAIYAQTVGGSSTHFSGNFWRFKPQDFKERSLLGPVAGTGLRDWPLSYEELEPYYTRVDWEIGVSGAPGSFDPPRSRPYPMPPLPVKSSGVLLEKGARALGLHADPAPLAILSRPHNGRGSCIHCGFCLGFGCEAGAKSSTLVTMIPQALASGRCELRAECAVLRIETDRRGRASEVAYLDPQGRPRTQKAKAVIVSANGAETTRLLLLSESPRHPQGLANGSGLVGTHLMFNSHSITYAEFEQPLNDWKSVQCSRIVGDFYDSDPRRGFYGGGVLDARPFLNATPMMYALGGLPPDAPRWGRAYKQRLAHGFNRTMATIGNGTSLPLPGNTVTLDPRHRDRYGRPALVLTYRDHDDDLALQRFLQDRQVEILEAAGAKQVWRVPVVPQTEGAHLLGTARMGNDPDSSVVDRYHRAHEVPNLFICDGSSLVSSGRGQPTMTIQALAFRAAQHIARFAGNGEI